MPEEMCFVLNLLKMRLDVEKFKKKVWLIVIIVAVSQFRTYTFLVKFKLSGDFLSALGGGGPSKYRDPPLRLKFV